ncbi:MAG: sigma-70 family RNA polymerase sigma factor [Clostridiales bacterium]|nr:sigma-70 family RNA polymerase sigma factor [Candidatus Cacconaster stercorequi]
MTKERLRQYIALSKEAQQIKEQIEEINASMLSPKIQRINGVPSGGNFGGSVLETMVTRYDSLVAIYCEKMKIIAEEQKAIENAISTLNSNERIIMRARYIEGLPWDKVCEKICYSRRQVNRIHGIALLKIREPGE